jgi:general secretion pathway protein E
MNHRAFAEKLVNIGVLTAEQLEPARSDPAGSASWSKRLLGASRMKPAEFADLMATTQLLPRASLERMRKGTSLAAEFSLPFLHEAGLYPYRAPDGSLRLATADPFNVDAVDAIAVTLGGGVAVEVATFEDVELALDADKRADDAKASAEDVGSGEAGPDNSDSLRDLASGAPVVRALDDVFDAAVSLRASDIHFEPLGRDIQIRVRVDGVLRIIPSPRAAPARALVSRIKILAGLNIAEHRQPQDGRMRIKVRSRDFDVRVATMPTTTGEAAILRLLDRSGRLIEFGQLGFNARDRAVLSDKLTQPHGMIVVTGPTGSGKTTTLAAALASLNDATRKILTVEDPVEYEISGVNQSQVRPAAGLTFATALRAFMRQDPDVIMVGEVRDPETAKIAVQASLTGHLVMTTLHTNTAAAAVTRLVDIGVERYLIASTLSVVVGQRLLRTLCLDCRSPFTVGPREAERNPRILGLGMRPGTALYEPVGCERCGGTGYRGRRAIFECLEITEAVRRQILAGADDAAIERAGIAEGMATLVEDGKARCLEGLTSVDEVFRVAALR